MVDRAFDWLAADNVCEGAELRQKEGGLTTDMTPRQQNVSTTALFSVAISVVGLAITIAVGIARIGAIYGTVSNEHQQIFRQLQALGDKCK